MITVKFVSTQLLSEDGLIVKRYNAGEIHNLPNDLADISITNGWAEKAKAADRETKVDVTIETKTEKPKTKAKK